MRKTIITTSLICCLCLLLTGLSPLSAEAGDDYCKQKMSPGGAYAVCFAEFMALGVGLVVWNTRANMDGYHCGPAGGVAMHYCQYYSIHRYHYKWHKGELKRCKPKCYNR